MTVKAATQLAGAFTATTIGDPRALQRLLTAHAVKTDLMASQIGANLFASAVLVAGLAFTGGTSRYVQHGLGRAPKGWLCSRSKTAAWAGFELALETGHNATLEIRLQTGTTGTFDLLFF